MTKKYPQYIIDKAIEFRVKNKMTDEKIVEHLAVPIEIVAEWLVDYPLPEKSEAMRERDRKNSERFAKKRQESYDEGMAIVREVLDNFRYRSFVALYIADGYHKDRNAVGMTNSDPAVMRLSYKVMQELKSPDKRLNFRLQVHITQNEEELKAFWAQELNIESQQVKIQRRSTGNPKRWNSEYGVLTIVVTDTYFRCRLQAWMDYMQKQWLDKFGNQ